MLKIYFENSIYNMLSLYDGSIKFTTNKKCTNRKSFIKISPRLSKRQSCDNIIKAQHIQILQTKHLMVLIGVIKMRGKSNKKQKKCVSFSPSQQRVSQTGHYGNGVTWYVIQYNSFGKTFVCHSEKALLFPWYGGYA